MKQPVRMPALSDTMESGRLLRWLKRAGEAVEKGESIAEVETDKAVMEMEAFHSGTLIGPLAGEDHEYPVGETLAWIGDAEAAPAEEAAAASEQAPEKAAKRGHPPERRDRGGETEAEQPPEAGPREGAGEEIAGHGTGASAFRSERAPQAGSVLEQALAGRAPPRKHDDAQAGAALLREIEAGPPYRIEAQRQLRRVIAATVSQALQIPQFRIATHVDLGACKAFATAHDLSFTLVLAKACALTVAEFPDFNAAWTPDGLARRERVDVAIAMEAEHGLLTPTLRDVAGRALSELMQDWAGLKEKISSHRMAPQDYRGATFYLSNLGMFSGVLQFDAIVPPGATAILAVAAPSRSGSVVTLSCDHRVVFGADAARFLAALARRLAAPGEWGD